MNKNVLIAFGGATLIALVVAVMLNAMLKGTSKKTPDAKAVAQTEILVATKDILVGQLLTAQNIKWKDWPVDSVFPGTVQREGKDQKPLDALSGRVIRPIATGEPVIKSALVKNDGGFLAAMLKPGMRAAAVKVNAETMVGGFVNPGDYVDVILTYQTRINSALYSGNNRDDVTLEYRIKRIIDKNIKQYASETILQNVKVIGTDQRAIKKSEDTAGKVAKTVTLELTAQQTEILSLARQMGDLSLALRSLGDTTIIDAATVPTVSDSRLSQIYKEITQEVEAEEQSSGARRYNVRIYSGGAVTSTPVR